MYIKASVVNGNLSADGIIQNERYVNTLLTEILYHFQTILQVDLFHRASKRGRLDYFLLHLIVDESTEFLQNRGVYFLNKTIKVLRFTFNDEIFDEYALNIVSYDVSYEEGVSSMDAIRFTERKAMDMGDLHTVRKLIFGICPPKVVTFNQVRICTYLEVLLNSYHLSVKGVNLVLQNNSANSMQGHAFELLEWEYMIKGDQLLICVSDIIRLLGFSLKPEGNSAFACTQTNCILVFYLYHFYL